MKNLVDIKIGKNFSNSEDLIHFDLVISNKLIYSPLQLECSQIVKQTESAEYGAYTCRLNHFSIIFRVAKITPKKIGQFVTIWKRIENNPIQPYDLNDSFDFFVICVRKENNFGQFVFPKSVLLGNGILSKNGIGGKLGIRVYPPWEKPLNKQAQKTQDWQLDYFLNAPLNEPVDYLHAEKLYTLRIVEKS